jgi:peptidoglycan hydrolase-like protein with peptidoglycan-binding domain
LAAEVQQELKRRGYYQGSIDGNIGPMSRSAIRAYQADRGLSVTGRVDRSLLDALDIG